MSTEPKMPRWNRVNKDNVEEHEALLIAVEQRHGARFVTSKEANRLNYNVLARDLVVWGFPARTAVAVQSKYKAMLAERDTSGSSPDTCPPYSDLEKELFRLVMIRTGVVLNNTTIRQLELQELLAVVGIKKRSFGSIRDFGYHHFNIESRIALDENGTPWASNRTRPPAPSRSNDEQQFVEWLLDIAWRCGHTSKGVPAWISVQLLLAGYAWRSPKAVSVHLSESVYHGNSSRYWKSKGIKNKVKRPLPADTRPLWFANMRLPKPPVSAQTALKLSVPIPSASNKAMTGMDFLRSTLALDCSLLGWLPVIREELKSVTMTDSPEATKLARVVAIRAIAVEESLKFMNEALSKLVELKVTLPPKAEDRFASHHTLSDASFADRLDELKSLRASTKDFLDQVIDEKLKQVKKAKFEDDQNRRREEFEVELNRLREEFEAKLNRHHPLGLIDSKKD